MFLVNKNTSIIQQSDLQKQEWYSNLVEQIKATITEAVHNSRWFLVEGYWNVGKLIREEFPQKGITKTLQGLGVKVGISETTLWYCVQLYDKYSQLDTIPEGKNISWNKLITKYLPEQKKEGTPPLPNGKYNVIYCDPPWDIRSMVLEKWESPLEDKYPTMTMDELRALPVAELSGDDCVCFLWTTLSTLSQALELLEHWNFKYHITLTWDKGGGWSANGFHRRSELVLVGYKGKLNSVVKQKGSYIPTVFSEKKREHSSKPEIMYKYIEDRTRGKKIELFARKKRNGWDVWGNEV